jgi:hypothetical protein
MTAMLVYFGVEIEQLQGLGGLQWRDSLRVKIGHFIEMWLIQTPIPYPETLACLIRLLKYCACNRNYGSRTPLPQHSNRASRDVFRHFTTLDSLMCCITARRSVLTIAWSNRCHVQKPRPTKNSGWVLQPPPPPQRVIHSFTRSLRTPCCLIHDAKDISLWQNYQLIYSFIH